MNQSSSSKVKKLKCLYTKQMLKKRKVWSDGILKVSFYAGTYQATLIDGESLRETALESRQLETPEIEKLKRHEEFELEFECYLVTVLKSKESTSQPTFEPPLKLTKFVAPSRIAVPTKNQLPLASDNSTASRTVANQNFMRSGPYKISNDELDDIWGCTEGNSNALSLKNVETNEAMPDQGNLVPPMSKGLGGVRSSRLNSSFNSSRTVKDCYTDCVSTAKALPASRHQQDQQSSLEQKSYDRPSFPPSYGRQQTHPKVFPSALNKSSAQVTSRVGDSTIKNFNEGPQEYQNDHSSVNSRDYYTRDLVTDNLKVGSTFTSATTVPDGIRNTVHDETVDKNAHNTSNSYTALIATTDDAWGAFNNSCVQDNPALYTAHRNNTSVDESIWE